MDKIAYIAGETVIYWNSIVLTLAAATAILFFLAFYIGKCGNAVAAFAAVPITGKISLSSKKSTKAFHFVHVMRVVERREATCKKIGYIKYKCYKCSYTTKTIIKAKPHKVVIDKAVPATCTSDGFTEGSHCSRCGMIIKKPEIIKAKGQHRSPYVEVITPANTERDGEYLMLCCDCDEVLSGEISYRPARIALYETRGSSQVFKKEYAYTGRPVEPSVKVYDSKGQKIHDCNYSVEYYDNVNTGTAKVVIDFDEGIYGIYEGRFEIEFTIVEK